MPQPFHYSGAEPLKRQTQDHYHVMIATPTTRGLCPSYAMALAATVETLVRFGVRFDFHVLSGDCHVDDARNLTIRDFLKTDCTDLFFIDSDMGWDSRDFLRLLQAPGDIVGGIYCHKNDKESYPFHPGKGEREANEAGLFEMPKVPTGFMRIRRPVLEALYAFEEQRKRVMWPQSAKPGDRPMARIVERAFPQDLPFDLPENTEYTYHSGDYVLCLKAKHLGFSVFADIDLAFDHVGEKIWSGHCANHLRREHGLDHPHFDAAIAQIRERQDEADLSAFDTLFATNVHSAGFAMTGEKLKRCHQMARNAQGHILEFGSGLSTLVMGLALAGTDRQVVALEHSLHALRLTLRWLQKYGVTNVTLIHAPLTAYEGGDWYAVSSDQLPGEFDCILMDGPPRHLSNRAVAFDVLGELINEARLWFIDDCEGGAERSMVERFAEDRQKIWMKSVCVAEKKQALSVAAE